MDDLEEGCKDVTEEATGVQEPKESEDSSDDCMTLTPDAESTTCLSSMPVRAAQAEPVWHDSPVLRPGARLRESRHKISGPLGLRTLAW